MKLSRHGWIDDAGRDRFAQLVIDEFSVKASGVDAAANSLSGGNLQKFSVGREILQKPGILIVDQPTWGVDAGSAAAIQSAILDLAAEGAAILVISQDLDEIFAISDRVAVLSEGQLSKARPIDEVSIEEIGLLMGGIHGGTVSTQGSAR